MKTKELIEKLQAADPSGELHVCVNNEDIYDIAPKPANYDGYQKIYIHNEHKDKAFSITGVLVNASSFKVQITSYSLKELLADDPDTPVYYSSDIVEKNYKPTVDRLRKEYSNDN